MQKLIENKPGTTTKMAIPLGVQITIRTSQNNGYDKNKAY